VTGFLYGKIELNLILLILLGIGIIILHSVWIYFIYKSNEKDKEWTGIYREIIEYIIENPTPEYSNLLKEIKTIKDKRVQKREQSISGWYHILQVVYTIAIQVICILALNSSPITDNNCENISIHKIEFDSHSY
jgi:hypothetical protein